MVQHWLFMFAIEKSEDLDFFTYDDSFDKKEIFEHSQNIVEGKERVTLKAGSKDDDDIIGCAMGFLRA